MDQKMWDKGLGIRKAVMGEAYVANAMKNVDSFSRATSSDSCVGLAGSGLTPFNNISGLTEAHTNITAALRHAFQTLSHP